MIPFLVQHITILIAGLQILITVEFLARELRRLNIPATRIFNKVDLTDPLWFATKSPLGTHSGTVSDDIKQLFHALPPDVQFEPLVQLEKVEVKSGNENDEEVYRHRAKLFRFEMHRAKPFRFGMHIVQG